MGQAEAGAHSPGPAPAPGVITGPDDVVTALRELRRWAQHPSYADIARIVRDIRTARGVPAERARPARTTIYDCFREGRTRFDPDLIADIAEALTGDQNVRTVWRHAARAATPAPDHRGVVPQVMSLPARPEPFVGRDDALRPLLDPGGPRVHVIRGLAGVGKTALAVTAAHELLRRGTVDTVVHVQLAGFDTAGHPADPFDVMSGVLRVHLPAATAAPAAETLRTRYLGLLSARRSLLLLDDAASWRQTEALLPRDSTTRVIVTSRWNEPLPDAVGCTTLDVLDESAAHRLLDLPDSGPARELCDLTGRLPLALTLARAQLAGRPDWTQQDHADAYRDRLRSLQVGHEVEATLGVTYTALSDAGRHVLRMTSLHPTTTIGLDAVAALTDLPEATCRTVLRDLEDAHLVRSTTPDRATDQWEMHSLVKVFGEQMAVRDERPQQRKAAVRRLMDHYLRTAAAAIAATQPGATKDWYWMDTSSLPAVPPPEAATWLRREHSNLLTVAFWAAEQHQTDASAKLAAVLSPHLWEGGQLTEAVTLNRTAQAAAVIQQDSAGAALAERNLGMAHLRLSRYDRAATYLERAETLFRGLDDGDGAASASNNLAIIATMTGRYDEALERMEAVCAHYRRTGDDEHLVGALTNIGVIRARTGDVTGSVEIQQEAADLARRHGWEKREQLARSNVAGLLADTGDPALADQAVTSGRRAVLLARRRGDESGQAFAEANLGMSLHLAGYVAEGRRLVEHALHLATTLTIQELVTSAHNNLGEMLLREGENDAARTHFEQAHEIAEQIGEAYELERARDHLDRLPR
ncbi:tetratricopeptide repeat protein [Flexivirga sp. B27]